jgi:hypothetical protein
MRVTCQYEPGAMPNGPTVRSAAIDVATSKGRIARGHARYQGRQTGHAPDRDRAAVWPRHRVRAASAAARNAPWLRLRPTTPNLARFGPTILKPFDPTLLRSTTPTRANTSGPRTGLNCARREVRGEVEERGVRGPSRRSIEHRARRTPRSCRPIPWTWSFGPSPIGVQEARARSRTARSALIWEILAQSSGGSVPSIR